MCNADISMTTVTAHYSSVTLLTQRAAGLLITQPIHSLLPQMLYQDHTIIPALHHPFQMNEYTNISFRHLIA